MSHDDRESGAVPSIAVVISIWHMVDPSFLSERQFDNKKASDFWEEDSRRLFTLHVLLSGAVRYVFSSWDLAYTLPCIIHFHDVDWQRPHHVYSS